MPPEITWYAKGSCNKWLIYQIIVAADCVTEDIYKQARDCVKKNLRVSYLSLNFRTAIYLVIA